MCNKLCQISWLKTAIIYVTHDSAIEEALVGKACLCPTWHQLRPIADAGKHISKAAHSHGQQVGASC